VAVLLPFYPVREICSMKIYRITKATYAHDLTGTGGLYGPGRWHREGTRIVYAAESIALAMLEVLGHWPKIPANMSLITLEIPDNASIKTLKISELPADWRNSPGPQELADIGERWIQEGSFWLVRVPSVHVPTEFDYLLNPFHPEHQTLKISSIEPYPFDARLK
jgi:RES domain-containing protein